MQQLEYYYYYYYCIISNATVVGAPVGIASARFTIVFSFATGIIKKLLKRTKKKKRKEKEKAS